MSRRKRHSAKALAERWMDFAGKCAECGCKLGVGYGLEWDHIIPLEMGGDDETDNLQPLCKGCHRAKTRTDVKHIAKGKRQQQRQRGIPKGGLKQRSPWKVRPPCARWPRGYLVHRETGEERGR